MANRVRVWNDTKADIGLRDYRGIEYNIKPKSFVMLDEEDVAYFVSIARSMFDEPHRLRVENTESAQRCGIDTTQEDITNAEFIKKNLSKPVSKVRDYINNVDDLFLADIIVDVANSMDLPNSKMNVLREKWPEKFE